MFPKSKSGATTALISSALLYNTVQGFPALQDAADAGRNTLTFRDATNSTQGVQTTGLRPCDALIEAGLSHITVMPSDTQYGALVNGTWALDFRTPSWCYAVPTTAQEVSQVVTALKNAGGGAGDWSVALRSGGHGSDNANNIKTGVTIDMTHMNATTYDENTKIAGVNSGARWLSVYTALDKYKVSVTGGREGIVGVGGLILGGGISYYTAREGFACDNVVNFEVVLASGEIVNANPDCNPDLFKALKGGSSNFGIVTRFDLRTYPVTNLDVERRIVDVKDSDAVIDGIVEFTNLDRSYADNAMLAILQYNNTVQQTTMMVTMVQTANVQNSSAYAPFYQIPTIAPVMKMSQTLPETANRAQVPGATRNAGAGSITLANDPRILKYAVAQHNELVETLKKSIGPETFSTIADIQPFPKYFATIGVEKGGNMLGLERNDKNMIVFVCGATIYGPRAAELQPYVYSQVAALNSRVEAYAKSVGGDIELRYLPYANARQDVLGSYGAENVKFLKETAKKYDPEQFFQRRVPGGYKISRVGDFGSY